MLRLRDRHDAADRLFGANLNCGVYDITGTPSRHAAAAGERRPRHRRRRQLVERGHVLQLGAPTCIDPDVSPLYADLRGLCPALFTVGTGDTLLDDSVFMAARWELAGTRPSSRCTRTVRTA